MGADPGHFRQNPHKIRTSNFETLLSPVASRLTEPGARPWQLVHVAVRVCLAIEVTIEVYRQPRSTSAICRWFRREYRISSLAVSWQFVILEQNRRQAFVKVAP